MPEMAFAPDMRGVWSICGTLEMTSKPTKQASTKTKSEISKVSSIA
jgi:hypothetical protein